MLSPPPLYYLIQLKHVHARVDWGAAAVVNWHGPSLSQALHRPWCYHAIQIVKAFQTAKAAVPSTVDVEVSIPPGWRYGMQLPATSLHMHN